MPNRSTHESKQGPRPNDVSPSVTTPVEGGDERRNRYISYCLHCLAVVGFAWWLSPFGPFAAIVWLVAALRVFYLRIYHRPTKLLYPLFLLTLFVSTGIVDDAFNPLHYAAICRDGTYSRSANRSGTCSWHGGVAGWNPTAKHWWQSRSRALAIGN
jgi:hypothetical protein